MNAKNKVVDRPTVVMTICNFTTDDTAYQIVTVKNKYLFLLNVIIITKSLWSYHILGLCIDHIISTVDFIDAIIKMLL